MATHGAFTGKTQGSGEPRCATVQPIEKGLGAGFSTLQLLGELMPNYVKLDMGLFRNVHQNRFRSELVRQIIELAHGFDIKVIAEGIEVFAEAAWLRSQGVDYLQGFYFARPAIEPLHRLDRRQKS